MFLNSEIFEHEKGLNIEKVQRMQSMEKDMVAMDSKLKKLRTELLNAEKRAHGLIRLSLCFFSRYFDEIDDDYHLLQLRRVFLTTFSPL